MSLTREQQATLDRLLRNESDVAYRRRVHTMMRYLDLTPGMRILDCGTGMGFYSLCMTSLYDGLVIDGIDQDAKALAFAAKVLAGRPVALHTGDIMQLPFADGVFDRVLLTEVLEHLPDDLGGLEEIIRVLKPGGVLAITVPYEHYPWWYDPINRASMAIRRRPIRNGPFAGIWAYHQRLYDEQSLMAVIQEAGFEADALEHLTHYCFPGTQTWVYTVGKGLIEHGLLPDAISKSTHRFRGEDNPGAWWNPLNWALAVVHAFDRLNETRRARTRRTFVNLAVRAVKPMA